MSKFRLNKLPKKERIRLIGEFYKTLGTIKNREEAALLFRDLLDGNEIGNLMRRIDVAVLLMLGFGYDEIVSLLGVGKPKIANVQKRLDRGGDGYRFLIKRLLEDRKKHKIKMIKRHRKILRRDERPGIGDLKQRYPGLFMIDNILDEFGDSLVAHQSIKSDQEEALEFYQKHSPEADK